MKIGLVIIHTQTLDGDKLDKVGLRDGECQKKKDEKWPRHAHPEEKGSKEMKIKLEAFLMPLLGDPLFLSSPATDKASQWTWRVISTDSYCHFFSSPSLPAVIDSYDVEACWAGGGDGHKIRFTIMITNSSFLRLFARLSFLPSSEMRVHLLTHKKDEQRRPFSHASSDAFVVPDEMCVTHHRMNARNYVSRAIDVLDEGKRMIVDYLASAYSGRSGQREIVVEGW
jgi:hypothetical protein